MRLKYRLEAHQTFDPSEISDNLLLVLAVILLVGAVIGSLTSRLKITAIVGYIVAGVLLGPSMLGLVSLSNFEIDLVVNVTLAIVAFTIGISLTRGLMKKLGRSIVFIILAESLGAFLVTTVIIYVIFRDLPLALVFGSLAPASAPAGTLAVIHEYRSRGPMTKSLIAVVGFDDGFAVLIFVLALALAEALHGGHVSINTVVIQPLLEIFGAILLGIVVGFVGTRIARRLRHRDQLFLLVVTSIFVVAGVSILLDLSLILSSIILGMFFSNVIPRITKTVNRIFENMLLPIYIMFFVVIGSELQISLLLSMGALGIVYIFSRTLGLVGGAFTGARLGKAPKYIQKYLGWGILCQAGVALGFAFIAAEKVPGHSALIITTIAATTVVFETLGPIGTRFALKKAGEIRT